MTDSTNNPAQIPGDDDFRMPEIALNSLDDAVLVCMIEAPFTITFANSALSRIRGSRRKATNAPFPRSNSPFPAATDGPSFVRLFVSPPEKKSWESVMNDLRVTGRSVQYRLILRPGDRADPNPVPVDVRLTPVVMQDGSCVQFIAVLRDVRALLYAEKERADIAKNLDCVISELSSRALHDNMTGLPNRFYFRQKIELNMAAADKRRTKIGFALIDLDNFKEINDTLGHASGDALLMRVVDAFRKLMRPDEYVVRWGGDEFLWVVPNLAGSEELMARLPSFIEAVSAVGRPDASVSGVTASIGHAIYPDDGASADDLISMADYAMYRVKSSGKNGWYRFDESVRDGHYVAPSAIFRKIHSALESGAVRARFTPVVDLRSGRIASLECRLAWVDEELGEICPNEFQPYVERKGLLPAFTYAMLDRALDELKPALRERPDLRVAIDVPLTVLTDSALHGNLTRICAAHGVRHSLLTLRFVERKPFVNRPGCREIIDRLRAEGFRLSLAHYASGAMSNETFLALPLDELELDGTVVRDAGSVRAGWLLKGVIEMAGKIGVDVVADGIDNDGVLTRLIALGYRLGKGETFGSAFTADELRKLPAFAGK